MFVFGQGLGEDNMPILYPNSFPLSNEKLGDLLRLTEYLHRESLVFYQNLIGMAQNEFII